MTYLILGASFVRHIGRHRALPVLCRIVVQPCRICEISRDVRQPRLGPSSTAANKVCPDTEGTKKCVHYPSRGCVCRQIRGVTGNKYYTCVSRNAQFYLLPANKSMYITRGARTRVCLDSPFRDARFPYMRPVCHDWPRCVTRTAPGDTS